MPVLNKCSSKIQTGGMFKSITFDLARLSYTARIKMAVGKYEAIVRALFVPYRSHHRVASLGILQFGTIAISRRGQRLEVCKHPAPSLGANIPYLFEGISGEKSDAYRHTDASTEKGDIA